MYESKVNDYSDNEGDSDGSQDDEDEDSVESDESCEGSNRGGGTIQVNTRK